MSHAIQPKLPNSHQSSQQNKGQSIATLTLDEDNKQTQTIRTTCPYCGVGCGVLATVNQSTRQVSVVGDPEHPANFGKLCSKGSALAQTLDIKRRITAPYYNQSYYDKTAQTPQTPHDTVNWEDALDNIATRLNDTIAKHGQDSVMFYVSGQLLTEDYYVANKLIKGFIGNNNIDSNSRLCMSSAVAGHKRAFGADLVTGNYEDLEACELLVLVGSNMAWCHPILFGRYLKAKQANPSIKLVVIDPRRTDSCEFADLHLPIAAGTDTHLYNGLLHYLAQAGCQDTSYIAQCEGLEEALHATQDWSIEQVATTCQVHIDRIRQFYQMVANTAKTVTAFSMGVNQSSSGTDKVNAIINTHLLTGRVGKVGASPFSLTGQPNAMGGREVGALANLLAAHLDLSNAEHRQAVADFWQAPQSIAPQHGVKACDVADAILDGRIKAIWIMATNPVVSLPDADRFSHALSQCELVIVSDCSKDSDTVQCADIVLPAQGWSEKSGTVTNSERRISRQRRLLPAVGVAKPDWWIISQVARRMGFNGFDYTHPSEIFNEHVALTAWRNHVEVDVHVDVIDDATHNLTSTHASHTSNARLNKSFTNAGIPRYLNLAKDLLRHTHPTTSTTESEINNAINSAIKPTVNSTITNSTLNQKNPAHLSATEYDALPPFQWGNPRIDVLDDSDTSIYGKFITITPPAHANDASDTNFQPRRAATRSSSHLSKLPATSKPALVADSHTDAISLRLITGRLRDQWHTMTRTGLAAQLNQQQSVPTLTLHPQDAKQLGVSEQDMVQINARYADMDTINPAKTVMATVTISDGMRVGDAFMPMHWSDAFASLARVGTLIPTVVDPHSNQPELKNTAIRVRPVRMHSLGKILVHPDWQDAMLVQLRTLLANIDADHLLNTASSQPSTSLIPALTWSLSRQQNSVLFNIASPDPSLYRTWLTPDFWQQLTKKLCQQTSMPSFASAFTHTDNQQLRFVLTQRTSANAIQSVAIASNTASNIAPSTTNTVENNATSQEALMFAVFLAPSHEQLPSTHWLDSCFAGIKVPSIKWLLAGRPASGYIDPGPLVCSCMSVGQNIIINAITKHHCHDAASVGKQCRAGTNCGSCVGQINELIAEYA